MKKIWILNHYAGNMFFEKGGRHYNFSKYLHRAGYNVTVFCCNAKHNSNAENYFNIDGMWQEYYAEDINTPFVFIKGRPYIGNGKQRILNMLDFYLNVQKAAKEYAKIKGKPDVIIGSSVHPLTCVAAIHLSKFFRCRNIVEIRDLWPESFVAFGLISEQNLLLKLLYAGERWIYKKADAVVFSVEGGADYIIEKGWDTAHGGPIDMSKVCHINNGVDLEMFISNKENYDYDDPDLNDPAIFKVVYTGSIRKANRIEILPEVAKLLKEKGQCKIKFLLWGAGDHVESVRDVIEEYGLENIVLKGFVEKKYVPSILEKGDLNIYVLTDSPLYKFGLSLNKMFEYFASGKPVLASTNSGYSIIDRYQCGVCLEEFDPENMAEEIIRFVNMPKEEYETYCANARNAAKDYDFKKLTDKLEGLLKI